MKTRTYKALLIVIILLQLCSGALAWVAGTSVNSNVQEQKLLLRLATDLLHFHVQLGEHEMAFAANIPMEDTSAYDKVRLTIQEDIDALDNLTKNQPDRNAVYAEQKKLFNAADRVLATLRDSAAHRVGGDRYALLIVLMAGMRKLAKLNAKITENIEALIDQDSVATGGLNPAALAAIAMSGLSIGLAAVLMVKAPKSY